MSKFEFFKRIGILIDYGFGVRKTNGTEINDIDYYNIGICFTSIVGFIVCFLIITLVTICVYEHIKLK